MKISDEDIKKLMKLAFIIIGLFWALENINYFENVMSWFIRIISPLLIAIIIAYIVNLIMVRIEYFLTKHFHKKGIHPMAYRYISLMLSLLFLVALISLVLSFVIPEIFNTFYTLAAAIPDSFDQFIRWTKRYSDKYPQIHNWLNELNPNWMKITQQVFDYVKAGLFGVFGTTFSLITTIVDFVIAAIISIILSVYILISKEKLLIQIKRFMKAYLPERFNRNICHVGRIANESFSHFITGKIIDAFVVGVLCTSGMLIFRIPYSAMVGTIVGVTALIPIIGAYIGMIVGAFLILMISPLQTLKFVIFLSIMHIFEGNVIYPKIIGYSVGLPAVWTLIAIVLGGSLFGITGMILAVPLASTIYTVLGEHIENRLKKNIINHEEGL